MCHVWHKQYLDGGGTRRAIQSNWGVNCSNQKFGGTLKKESKFKVVKCNCPFKLMGVVLETCIFLFKRQHIK